jgi:uncharacterized membrane protein AbrB (regulator of aidB expression)
MKKALATILQFFLFLIVFFTGSIFPLPPALHHERVISSTPAATRIFIGDGLHLMLALFLVIVLIEAVTKRLRTAAPWTTLALILATVLGFMMKFGSLTRSAY